METYGVDTYTRQNVEWLASRWTACSTTIGHARCRWLISCDHPRTGGLHRSSTNWIFVNQRLHATVPMELDSPHLDFESNQRRMPGGEGDDDEAARKRCPPPACSRRFERERHVRHDLVGTELVKTYLWWKCPTAALCTVLFQLKIRPCRPRRWTIRPQRLSAMFELGLKHGRKGPSAPSS